MNRAVVSAIIDTNILVSALGNEALLVLAVKQGLVRPYFSEEILDEYSIVLPRPKFAFHPDEIAALMDVLQGQGDLVHPTPLRGSSPDPGDDKFIACALAARVDFLVTGNKRDFPQNRVKPTKVVSAGELLDLLTLEIASWRR